MRAFVEVRRLSLDYTNLSVQVKELRNLVNLHNEQLAQILTAMEGFAEEKDNEKNGRVGK